MTYLPLVRCALLVVDAFLYTFEYIVGKVWRGVARLILRAALRAHAVGACASGVVRCYNSSPCSVMWVCVGVYCYVLTGGGGGVCE